MKQLAVILALCVAVLMIGGCAVPLGENFSVARETTQNGIYIIDYNLQTYVPVPVTGERPIQFVANRGDLEISVTWIADNAEIADLQTFAAGTDYSAKIELSPRAGYLFNPSISFAYHPGKVMTQTDDKLIPNRTVLVTYNNSDYGNFTRVTNYDLQNYVPVPVAGQTAAPAFTKDGVTGTVTWGGAALDQNKFVKGALYTAEIKLTPMKDYFFDKTRSFAYVPAKVKTQTDDDKSIPTRIVEVAYKEALEQVTNRDLTDHITAPVLSASPNTGAVNDPQYTGPSVSWSPAEAFVKDKTYTATVALTATAGYTFSGLGGTKSFRHDNSSAVVFTVGDDDTTGTATVVFSPNSSSGVTVNVTTTWGGGQ
jgi:hypothetical protein